MIQHCSINIHPGLSSNNFVDNPQFRCIQCWQSLIENSTRCLCLSFNSFTTTCAPPRIWHQQQYTFYQMHFVAIVTLLDKEDKEYKMSSVEVCNISTSQGCFTKCIFRKPFGKEFLNSTKKSPFEGIQKCTTRVKLPYYIWYSILIFEKLVLYTLVNLIQIEKLPLLGLNLTWNNSIARPKSI